MIAKKLDIVFSWLNRKPGVVTLVFTFGYSVLLFFLLFELYDILIYEPRNLYSDDFSDSIRNPNYNQNIQVIGLFSTIVIPNLLNIILYYFLNKKMLKYTYVFIFHIFGSIMALALMVIFIGTSGK